MLRGPSPHYQLGVEPLIHNTTSTEMLPSSEGSINRAENLFAVTTSGVEINDPSSSTKEDNAPKVPFTGGSISGALTALSTINNGSKVNGSPSIMERTGSLSITERNTPKECFSAHMQRTNRHNMTKHERNANAKRRQKESKNKQKQKKTSQVRNDSSSAVVETTDNSAPPSVPQEPDSQQPEEAPYDFGEYQEVNIYVRCRLKTFQESWFDLYGGWNMLIHDTIFVLPILSILLWFLMEFTDHAWCWQFYFAIYWLLHLHFNIAMASVLVCTTFVYPFLVYCGVPHLNLLTIIVLYIFRNKVDPYVVPPGFTQICTLPCDTMSVHLALKHTHYKQVRISEKILDYLLDELWNLKDSKNIINTALYKVNKLFKMYSIEDRTNTARYFKNLLTFKQVTDDSFVSSGGNIGAS